MLNNFKLIQKHIHFKLLKNFINTVNRLKDFRNIYNFLFFYFLRLKCKNYFIENNFLNKVCMFVNQCISNNLEFQKDFFNIKNLHLKNNLQNKFYTNLFLIRILYNLDLSFNFTCKNNLHYENLQHIFYILQQNFKINQTHHIIHNY